MKENTPLDPPSPLLVVTIVAECRLADALS